MSETRDQQQPDTDMVNQEHRTPQQIDEELQQAIRREAATRDTSPDTMQISDSANQDGMGPQGSGHGRRSGQHS